MMRLLRTGIIAGFVLTVGAAFIAASATSATAQVDTEHIATYAVAMHLQRDGTLLMNEQIGYDFGASPHHGITRDLVEREHFDAHNDRLYRISDVKVTADGGPAQVQTTHTGPYLHLRVGDPDVTVTGLHHYTIAYTVQGAAQTFPDHQELYWDAIGTQWLTSIDKATVTVTAPASIFGIACYSGVAGSQLSCTKITMHGATATFIQKDLSSQQGVTIVVGQRPGTIVPNPQPILERRRTLSDAFARRPNTVVPAILVALLAMGSVIALAWRRGRDRRFAGSAVDAAFGNTTGEEERVGVGRGDAGPVEFVPPDGVLPGQVGTLVDEHTNLVDVTATIIDLAVRGWLTITEDGDDYQLDATQVAGKGTLLPYETELMNALFGAGPSILLSALKYKFRAELALIEGEMYQDSVTQGWYRMRPDKTRQHWRLIAIGAVLLAIIGTTVVSTLTSFGLIPLGLLLGAITLLAVAGHMPSRTGKGSAMYSRVRGFRRLFDEGDQGLREKFAEQHDIFSKYLPYAIVFGCTDKWARVFSQLDAAQLETGWYRGSTPFNAVLLASSINNFGTVATGTLYASAPSSSSSSGFGGGFSGGGGGGGGGGSW
jgi:hypothetical protein